MSVATARQPWSSSVLNYFASHAISPRLAANLGVAERDRSLIFTVATETGSFRRTRRLNGCGPAKVLQPRGQSLELWWPRWRPELARTVLVVEGESDALAAASALEAGPPTPFDELPIAALPGCGFPVRRLVEELVRVECRFAYFALDADEAGRKFTRSACRALDFTGIHTAVLSLPEGADLADVAAAKAPDDRAAWMVELLLAGEGGAR